MWLMGVLLLLGGMAIAPTLIATMSVVEREVPTGRLNEGLAIVHTGLGIGIAPGAALAGMLIAEHGANPAYRSEEGRVGKGCVSTGRSGWTTCPEKTNKHKLNVTTH